MSKGTAIIAMLISLAVGYFLGGYMGPGRGGGGSVGAMANIPAAALPDPNVERFKVPVGNSPVKGDDGIRRLRDFLIREHRGTSQSA